jgi:uncharacterized protein YjbI with pentapeptide repeats
MQSIFKRSSRILLVSLSPLLLVSPSPAHADIFQWEYINPADPSQGKRQSSTLAPDGAGVDAVPGANLSYRNLTTAYLFGADLGPYILRDEYGNPYDFVFANLTNVNLSHAELTNAYFWGATLTGANFTDAEVRGANFGATSSVGFTAAQLYSTASYQAHDLSGIGLSYNDLPGANFAGQNLTNASFYGGTLTGAAFRQANLTNANFTIATLTGADFVQANLTKTSFYAATLTDADFTAAEVRGADFGNYEGTGITPAQLYSTASYQAHDLSGIDFTSNNLAGGNFAGQNLTNALFFDATLTDTDFRGANLANAYFQRATLTGADFRDANLTNANFTAATLTDADFTGTEVRGASFNNEVNCGELSGSPLCIGANGITLPQLYSTASYQAHDLTGINLGLNVLSGANFAGQNLTNAVFYAASLTDADFAGADIKGANFDRYISSQSPRSNAGTGISPAQLYTTASYQAKDLSGINFSRNDLEGANFAGQNLSNASFVGATLTGADFTGADIRGANFSQTYGYLDLIGTGISPAQLYTTASYQQHDIRGVAGFSSSIPATTNLILPNGHIDGLDLYAGNTLTIRDFNGNPTPIPVSVEEKFAMGPGGKLRMVFETDAWDSTISFAPGIPVTLGGTLELTFAADVNLASQLGRTFHIFDWARVNPIGAFNVSSPHVWDLSKLYTTGEVTLTAIPEPTTVMLIAFCVAPIFARRNRTLGDFNHDGSVDTADYIIWRKNPGGIYTQTEFNTWRANLGQTTGSVSTSGLPSGAVPEPAGLMSVFIAGLCFAHAAAARYPVRHGRRHSDSLGHRARRRGRQRSAPAAGL